MSVQDAQPDRVGHVDGLGEMGNGFLGLGVVEQGEVDTEGELIQKRHGWAGSAWGIEAVLDNGLRRHRKIPIFGML